LCRKQYIQKIPGVFRLCQKKLHKKLLEKKTVLLPTIGDLLGPASPHTPDEDFAASYCRPHARAFLALVCQHFAEVCA